MINDTCDLIRIFLLYSLKEICNVVFYSACTERLQCSCVFKFNVVSPEAAARLKQLELESSPLLGTPKNNINVNMVMNNQVGICSYSISVHFLF